MREPGADVGLMIKTSFAISSMLTDCALEAAAVPGAAREAFCPLEICFASQFFFIFPPSDIAFCHLLCFFGYIHGMVMLKFFSILRFISFSFSIFPHAPAVRCLNILFAPPTNGIGAPLVMRVMEKSATIE